MIENINVGLTANDGLGDKLRDAFIIVNENFDAIDVILTGTGTLTISQIAGLQTALDNIQTQLDYIPGLQTDINSINTTIYTINQTLNSQNGSISDLYSLVNDLQQQIYTKIGDAPIDGEQYVRQDGEWVISSAGGETLLQNITPDVYLGPRLAPISATSNGFYINSSTNSAVGLFVKNTDNTGNGSVAAVTVGGTGSLFQNYTSLFHANAGYYVPYLRGKSGLNSDDDFFFIGSQGASFDFRTGNGSYGTETSKFAISNSGTVSIGVQPVLDNTITDILGRKSDGSIVRVDKSYLKVTKTSELINDGDNGISHFISLEDLPSNLILYATATASGISTYYKLVSSITDPAYNTTAVDVPTGTITTTNQFIAGLVTSPGLIVGNPGVLNITTIGNITRTSGSGEAEFYFEIWKRTDAGVETLITTSDMTLPVTNTGYTEFSASALWNDGVFVTTDRIVLKFYGSRISGGSNPTYQFQFGGISPVRTLVPLPLTVVPGFNNIRRHSFSNYNPGTGNSLDYNGYAPQGSSESANVWTITRLTINAFGISTRAYAVNVAWTDRASVIYT